MAEAGVHIEAIRVKTVRFRDFACDDRPMEVLDWFALPEQNAAFRKHMEGFDGHGGEEEGKNGFEALEIGCAQTFVPDQEDRPHIPAFGFPGILVDCTRFGMDILTTR